MIDTTVRQLQTRGYHGTGLGRIVEESGSPRGSLYFHFPGGKDELVVAALDRVGTEFTDLLDATAANTSARDALSVVFDTLAARLLESDFVAGCAVASVTVDAAADSPPLQQACAEVYDAWRAALERLLTRDGIPDAARRAGVLLSLIEGATTVARARGDVQPLREAQAAVHALLGGAR